MTFAKLLLSFASLLGGIVDKCFCRVINDVYECLDVFMVFRNGT